MYHFLTCKYNSMSSYYPTVSLEGGPKFLSQQTQFKSASEVTTMQKRAAVNQYYRNYPQSQKAAYASTYTTFAAGADYNSQKGARGVSWSPTCCTNTNGFVLANNSILSPGGEKRTPNMNVDRNAFVNNPQ
jgi:hypothetical protein